MTATAFLALAALALAARAIEELVIHSRAEFCRGVSAAPDVKPGHWTPPVSPDPVIATIQLRRGRLVLVRRRA